MNLFRRKKSDLEKELKEVPTYVDKLERSE